MFYIYERGADLNKGCHYDGCNKIADWYFDTTDYAKLYACDDHVMTLRSQLKQENGVILTICAIPHLLNPDPSLYQDC